jgi:hypothetical protein
MTTKPNSLRQAMQGIANAAPAPLERPEERSPSARWPNVAPSRLGKRSVGGHFTPEVGGGVGRSLFGLSLLGVVIRTVPGARAWT